MTPAGVAAWGKPCTVEGPLSDDANTLLLLHFDGSFAGSQGEPGSPAGVEFAPGRYSSGVLIEDQDELTYASAGNLNRIAGAIEFWLRPNWDGDDNQSYTFFEAGSGWFNRLRITKDGANNLRFMVWDSANEYSVNFNIGDWQAGEWRHVAATWQGREIALFVDGQRVGIENNANPPDALADTIYIGSSLWHDQQADAVIDELRISATPRVGNSDNCGRILVADSGNHRLQAFDALGNFLSEFGSLGSDLGQFTDPQGIVVDNNGRVIVADRGNNRLQILSFDGTSFAHLSCVSAGFNAPNGLAVDRLGRIFVADTGNNRIVALSSTGVFLAEYTSPDDGYGGAFNQPSGVAIEPDGTLIVADTGNPTPRVVSVQSGLPTWVINLPLIRR